MNDLKLRLPYQDCLKRVGWRLPVLSCLVVTSQPLWFGTTLSTWRESESWSTWLSYIFIEALCTWVLNCMYLWRRWASAYCSKYSSTWVPTIWSKMFHPSSTSLPTSEWWRNDFCWLAKGKSGKAMTCVDKEKNLEDKSSSPLLEG